MRAIIDISQTLEETHERLPDIKTLLRNFSSYLKVSQYKWSFDHKGIDQRYPKLSVKVIPIIISIFLTVTWLTSDVLNAGIDMPRYRNLDDIIVHPYSMELQEHWLSIVTEIRNSIYSDHKTITCGLLMQLIEYIYHQMT